MKTTKTIAEQLKVTDFPFRIFDSNGNEIYYEHSNGKWVKAKFDSNDKVIYYENSEGLWYKWEYDSEGNEVYWENSYGAIIDNRNQNPK